MTTNGANTNSVATQPPESVVEDGSDDEDSHKNADALIQEKVGPSSGVTGSSLQQPPKVILSSSKQSKQIQFNQLKHEREELRLLVTNAVNFLCIDPTSVPSRSYVMDILIKIREIDNQLTEDPDQWDTMETSLRNDFSSKIQFIGKAIREQELKDKSVQSPPNATNVATTTHGANVTDASAPATGEPTVSPQVITNSSLPPTTEIDPAQSTLSHTQDSRDARHLAHSVGPLSQKAPPISVTSGNIPQSAVNSNSVPFNQLTLQQNQLLNLPPSSASGLGGHFATRNSSPSAQSLNTCTSSGVQMYNSVPPSSTRAESGDSQSARASYAQIALPQQQPVGQAGGPSHWTGALPHPQPQPQPPPPPPPHSHHQLGAAVNSVYHAQQFAITPTIYKFDGSNVTAFTKFWHPFQRLVHQNPNLTGADKFLLLKEYVVGNARQRIEGLPIDDEHYQLVIQQLLDEFDSVPAKRQDFVRSVGALGPLGKEEVKKSSTLKRFYSNAVMLYNRAKFLALGDQYIHMQLWVDLQNRVPAKLNMQLALENRNSIDSWLKGLSERVRAVEHAESVSECAFIQYARPASQSRDKKQVKTDHHEQRGNDLFTAPQRSAGVFMLNTHTPAGSVQGRAKGKCTFCQGKHNKSQCPLDAMQKYDAAEERDLCMVCFEENHGPCHKSFTCACGGQHPRFICHVLPQTQTEQYQPASSVASTNPFGQSNGRQVERATNPLDAYYAAYTNSHPSSTVDQPRTGPVSNSGQQAASSAPGTTVPKSLQPWKEISGSGSRVG